MKFLATVVTLALYSAVLVSGACDDVADGFASLNGGTTGGRGGTVVTVSNVADLRKYATSSGKYIIKVAGTINVTPAGEEIKVASDKTIVGVGNNAAIQNGGFGIHNVKNVIIRNLRITNPGDPDTSDHDGVQADTSSNIWIDHCHFESGGDGLVDLRKDTTFYTVSYNIFRNHDKTLGIGWTENVSAQATIHHNWFDKTNQRNPSADNLRYVHLYNNYLTGVTSYGHYARGSTEARVENVYFSSTKNPLTADGNAKLAASGNTYQSCSGTVAPNKGTVFNASTFYSYKLDPTANVPSIVSSQAGRQASIC